MQDDARATAAAHDPGHEPHTVSPKSRGHGGRGAKRRGCTWGQEAQVHVDRHPFVKPKWDERAYFLVQDTLYERIDDGLVSTNAGVTDLTTQ